MDDDEMYYVAKRGDLLTEQYQVHKQLGKGTFGTVYSCIDKANGKPVAVKVLRAVDKYHKAGQLELKTLLEIQQSDFEERAQLAQVINYFEFKKHLCIVFPLYGVNLLDLLKVNQFRGFNIDWTRELTRSYLKAVSVMHQLNKIHTDIKPENIVTRYRPVSTQVRDRIFVHPPGADMLLIDLGSAINAYDERKPVLVCTRQYRPPEIMLGLSYDTKLDIWSCGCVIYETITGKTLFRTHNSAVHLCLIQKIIGPVPAELMSRAIACNKCQVMEFFDYKNNTWRVPSDADEAELNSMMLAKPLHEELNGHKYELVHLLKWMLSWDPSERPTVKQVLEHPFFNESNKETRGVQTNTNNYREWADMIQAFVDARISGEDFCSWWKHEIRKK